MATQLSRSIPIGSPRGAPDCARQASDLDGSRHISPIERVAIRLLGPIEMGFYDETRGAHSATAPMAWPSLLTKEQLARYLEMSWSTVIKVCPVAPIDVGANLIRYNRSQIDEWVSTLPARGPNGRLAVIRRAGAPLDARPADRRLEALSRVSARAKRLDRR